MESKYFNRYKSLCRSLENLRQSKAAKIDDPFVLPATVQNYNLTFDLSWKVLKEVVTQEFGLTDFASGSPRETLKSAFSVGIINDDLWMEMLKVRNTLAHILILNTAFVTETSIFCGLMQGACASSGKKSTNISASTRSCEKLPGA